MDRVRKVAGRLSVCDIKLRSRHSSRRQASIVQEGEKLFVIDVGSINGTLVNNVRLRPFVEIEVQEGDRISLDGKLINQSSELYTVKVIHSRSKKFKM